MLFKIYLCILFYNIHGYYSLLSCKNENNVDIDWFIILKIPASYNYFYLSSDSLKGKWSIPNYALNNDNNLLAKTLSQIYSSQQSKTFFASYNDEKPYDIDMSRNSGHSKGVVNFDNKSGYWLVHSVPKFPPTDKYHYSNGESINGQSFFCVTLDTKYLTTIADQLLLMYTDVYSYNFPPHFSNNENLMSKLYKLVLNEHSPALLSKQINLKTLQGMRLTHFGKSHDDFKDLYHGIIGPALNASMYVESWMNGPGERLNSNCQTNNKVYNVRKVSIDGIEYSEAVDHSKWAVSASNSGPLVCIGDINRMATQKKRGGGSLCVFDNTIWGAFSPIVKDYEPCQKFEFIL